MQEEEDTGTCINYDTIQFNKEGWQLSWLNVPWHIVERQMCSLPSSQNQLSH